MPELHLALSRPNTAQCFLQYFSLFFCSDHIPIAILHTFPVHYSALLGQTKHCELGKVDSVELVIGCRSWGWDRMAPFLMRNAGNLRKRRDNMWRGEKHTNLRVDISFLVLLNAAIFSFYPCPQPLHFRPIRPDGLDPLDQNLLFRNFLTLYYFSFPSTALLVSLKILFSQRGLSHSFCKS